MARAGRSDCIVLILIILFCTGTVFAASVNSTGELTPIPPNEASDFRLFIPSSGSIHSTQVLDAINGKTGDVFFATSFGLSDYNGSWSTRHLTRDDLSSGLLDDFVTALEYDSSGNLWIGFPGGIQIDNGTGYTTIRDQQLLKSLRIKAFQRQGDAMWVATGNAGIHRFRNGTWSWYQPMSPGGPGFYEIDSMVLDPVSDNLLIATEEKGVWRVSSARDPVTFERIDAPSGIKEPLIHVRRDPLGGAYFFNAAEVIRYTQDSGWQPVLSVPDLTQAKTVINDIVAAPDGTLYVGTDDGIYIWREGSVVRHLSRFEGIGPSSVVTWLFFDAEDRLWFSTQNVVGYYAGDETRLSVIPIQILNQSPQLSPSTGSLAPPSQIVTTATTVPTSAMAEVPPKEPTLFERLLEFLSGLFEKSFGK